MNQPISSEKSSARRFVVVVCLVVIGGYVLTQTSGSAPILNALQRSSDSSCLVKLTRGGDLWKASHSPWGKPKPMSQFFDVNEDSKIFLSPDMTNHGRDLPLTIRNIETVKPGFLSSLTESHKFLRVPEKNRIFLLYPDNTAIGVDMKTCEILGMYLSTKKNKHIHPIVVSEAEKSEKEILAHADVDKESQINFVGTANTNSQTCAYEHFAKCEKKSQICLGTGLVVSTCPSGWNSQGTFTCGCGKASCDAHPSCSSFQNSICQVSHNPCNYDQQLRSKLGYSSDHMEKLDQALTIGQTITSVIPLWGGDYANLVMALTQEHLVDSPSNMGYDDMMADLLQAFQNLKWCFSASLQQSAADQIEIHLNSMKDAFSKASFDLDGGNRARHRTRIINNAERDCTTVKNFFGQHVNNKYVLTQGARAMELCALRYTAGVAFNMTLKPALKTFYTKVFKAVTRSLYLTVVHLRKNYLASNGCFFPDDQFVALRKLFDLYANVLLPSFKLASIVVAPFEEFPNPNGYSCRLVKGREFHSDPPFHWFPHSTREECENTCLGDSRCDCYVWRWGHVCYLKSKCRLHTTVNIGPTEYSGVCGARNSRCDAIRGLEWSGVPGKLTSPHAVSHAPTVAACEKLCVDDPNCQCYVWRWGNTCYRRNHCDPDFTRAARIGPYDYSGLCLPKTNMFKCALIFGREHHGTPMSGLFPTRQQSVTDCMNLCIKTPSCSCYAWITWSRDCFLKSGCTAGVFTSPARFSGLCR